MAYLHSALFYFNHKILNDSASNGIMVNIVAGATWFVISIINYLVIPSFV